MSRIRIFIFCVSIIASFYIILDQNLALNVRTLIALIPFVYGLCVMYLLPKKIILGACLLYTSDAADE